MADKKINPKKVADIVQKAVRTAVSTSMSQTPRPAEPKKELDTAKIARDAKYKTSGLTVTSNDTTIIPRDNAGNVVLAENQENPLLVIEPVATRITTESLLKVVDTRFNYYKFPVTVIERSGSNLDFDTAIDFQSEVDYSNIEDDLKIPLQYDSKGQPYGWVRINTSYDSTWFYNNGETSRGLRQLQFSGKNNSDVKNAYVLTQSAIDTLKEQKKTLRFRINIQGRCSIPNPTGFVMRLTRDNPKYWRTSFATPQIIAYSHHEDNGYPVIYMEYILDSNDMLEGDTFLVHAVSTNPMWTLDGNCWWEVRVVDIPKRKPLMGLTDSSGVYNINGGSLPVKLARVWPDGKARDVGAKFPGSDTFRFKNDRKFDYAAEFKKYTDKYGIQ